MVPPNKLKTRFNAKARQSFAGSTHKKRKNVRSKDKGGEEEESNATIASNLWKIEQLKKISF